MLIIFLQNILNVCDLECLTYIYYNKRYRSKIRSEVLWYFFQTTLNKIKVPVINAILYVFLVYYITYVLKRSVYLFFIPIFRFHLLIIKFYYFGMQFCYFFYKFVNKLL